MIQVGVVGGSGYTGGELLRLLLAHPEVEVTQATSESNIGKFFYQVHPHLRGKTQLRFIGRDALEAVSDDTVSRRLACVTIDDGTTEDRRLPVELWTKSDKVGVPIDTTKQIREVRIDPDQMLPDVDRSNNVWTATDETK